MVERTAEDAQFVRALLTAMDGIIGVAFVVGGPVKTTLAVEALLSMLSRIARDSSRGAIEAEHKIYYASIDYLQRLLDGTMLSYGDGERDGGAIS